VKRNLLQLIGSFHQGGSELQAVQLSRLLHESGRYNLHIACLDQSGVLRSDIDSLEVNLTDYPLTSFSDLNFISQLHRFAAQLRANRIEIVHTHDFYTNVFGMAAAWLARVPVRIASRRQTAKRDFAQRVAERLAYSFSHAIVANCDAAGNQLVTEGISREKIITIHNGLNLERVTPQISRAEALEAFNLPDARPFVTIVANLRLAMKDHPTFLRAAKIVRDTLPDTAFVIAGEGELLEPMRALAAELGLANDLFFIGHCDRLADLLALSRVCVLSSISEGFSNAILEYMAASRPVVATNVGGAAEAILDGQTGYLVYPGDHETMATRIASLLRNPAHAIEMGKRGRMAVEQRFSCEAQLSRTVNLYEGLLAAQKPVPQTSPIQSELTRG
jgi:glycosyltransferase involved in cell wall biosynthesis